MVYKDYKHGLYLLELFVLWLKISKCNCTYNQVRKLHINISILHKYANSFKQQIRKVFMLCCHDTGTFW